MPPFVFIFVGLFGYQIAKKKTRTLDWWRMGHPNVHSKRMLSYSVFLPLKRVRQIKLDYEYVDNLCHTQSFLGKIVTCHIAA